MESGNVTEIRNFIGGKFCGPTKRGFIESHDPSTGDVFLRLPDSGQLEVDTAVHAAKKAFTKWSTTSIRERSKILLDIANLIESRLDDFAEAETRDQGKPLWLAKSMDIPSAVRNFRHFAQSVLSHTDTAISQPEDQVLNYTVRSPVGVVAVISPWNFPLLLLTMKLAPAIVHGNTVVAKPSEFTSLTAFLLCKVFQDAGLPDGVVNVVFGYGNTVGEAMVRHPDVKLISFTGSTRTGTRISELAAPQAKKLSLEMGGKNAAIVFEDADIDKAAKVLIRSAFLNSGQVCLCTSRIYVHRSIYARFESKYVEMAKNLVVGPPEDETTFIGPVVSEIQLKKIRSYVEIAKTENAKFLTGNVRKINLPDENKNGYYIAPLVLTDVSEDSRLMKEEVFGPITCLQVFDKEDDVIRLANSTEFGLCAVIFSSNVSRIHRVAQQLEAGTVWCNCWLVRNLHMPFGGVKMSGIGREGTEDSRDVFTEKKTICLKL